MLRKNRWLTISAIALATVVLGLAGDTGCVYAQGSCPGACLAQYNQCRIATKGSPSCDQQYQRCLQKCVRR